jgi:SnoaL-like domain
MGTARDAAMEYFRCMRESDADSMERLFAEDAVLSLFNGTVRRGRREIRDFYENSGMQQGIRPNPQEPIEDDRRCAVEIVVGLADGSHARVVDIFTVNDDGHVSSLRIYQGLLLDGDAPDGGTKG